MLRRKVTLAVCLSFFFVDAAFSQPPASSPEPAFQLQGATAYEFKRAGEVSLSVHVFYPEGWAASDHRAAIVFFFGGGWVGGSPKQFQPQCEYLSQRGMVAISAEYRVRSRHGVHPATCVADAKDAVRWVRTKARDLGIDAARIAVAGGSAGGHLAASTATLEHLPEDTPSSVSCEPNALVLYNPVCDTTQLGYGGKRLGSRMTQLSPAHHIRPHMPPTVIFHGDADKTVPHENAARFQRLMATAGNACQLVTYPGAEHGFFNPGRKGSQYEDTTRQLDSFLTAIGFLTPASEAVEVAGRSLEQWQQELTSADATRRRRAAHSLGQFGELAAATFLAMLDDRDGAIRYIAASHIGDHKAPAEATNLLRRLLSEESRGLRTAAAYALCRLGDLESGLPVLGQAVQWEERGIACSAADFLARMGPPASPLANLLQRTRDRHAHGDYHIRGAVDNALRKIREDTSLIHHVRPTGGGNPRGWQPAGDPVPAKDLEETRPNILWISCEDISPNLGCYGDAYASTPHLDRLAREGVRFDRAFTPAGVCAVMRSGHITGVYPISQGSHHMRSHIVPPAGVKCFTEYLRAAGYFCTNKAKTDYQFPPPKTAWDRQGANHGDWRDRSPGQPFFSVINLTCTHESQIRHGEKTHAAILQRLSADQRHDPDRAAEFLPPIYPDTPEARKDWAWYADNISEMDRQAGLILRQLEEDGLADNTIVVFWSDHGRGLPRAKRWIYDSGIHVPLIVRWPGHLQPGTTREDLVSTQDLAPTLLSVAGLNVPPYMQGRVFFGSQEAAEPPYLFFHRDRMDEAYELMRAARDRRYKYIRNYHTARTYAQDIEYMNRMPTLVDLRQLHAAGNLTPAPSRFFRTTKPAEELYDLKHDPHETVNLAWMPEHAGRLAHMREALEAWQQDVEDLGLVPEPIMMEQMRPGHEVKRVDAPSIVFRPQQDAMEVAMKSQTEGASIAYRLVANGDEASPWQLYTQPVSLPPAATLEAVACRAGFQDSPTVRQAVPPKAP